MDGTALLALLALAAFALSVWARRFVGLDAPMWLDEAWTGAFASQPTLGEVTRQIRDDTNGPVFYYLMWLWAKAFGLSNMALRAPSLAFGLLTPPLATWALWRAGPRLALVWGGLLALWIPGVELSGWARGYTLLMLAAALATVAFVRVLETPSTGRAAVWVALAALTTLVHYHGGLVALAQALVFLGVHRRRALRTWPAGFAALPAAAWMAYHAPRLAAFARPDVAWYDLLAPDQALGVVAYAVGGVFQFKLVVAVSASALLFGAARKLRQESDAAPPSRAVLAAGGAAALGLALCLVIAMARPTFTLRYVTPFAPGLLLLVAAETLRLARGAAAPPALLLAGYGVGLLMWSAHGSGGNRPYNFETASRWIAEARPARLVFFWDHPATPVETPSQLDVVGGFFLRRAGLPVRVTPLFPRPGADMNAPALAASDARSAILWLYDTGVHGTTAIVHPPRLDQLDPRLECRDFGGFNIGVLACRRRGAPR